MEPITITISSDEFGDAPVQSAELPADITILMLLLEIRRAFDLPDERFCLTRTGESVILPPNRTLEQIGIKTGHALTLHRDHRPPEATRPRVVFTPILPEPATPLQTSLLRVVNTDQTFMLDQPTHIIGRLSQSHPESTADVTINLGDLPDGRSVSRRHARVTERNSQFFIESLAGHNPVRLNASELPLGQPQPLRSGDQIELGRVTLVYEGGDPDVYTSTIIGAADAAEPDENVATQMGDE